MKHSADVVIIGGGCMGASVAYHLTRRGITDIVLIEREKMLGTGSTGRNAGGVRHQFSNTENIRLSIESIHLIERFADEVGYPVDFHQDGYLFLLSTQESVDVFQKNVTLQRSLGVDVDWLDATAAARLAPGLDTTGVLAATFCARDGIADPNGVTMGFARAAQAAGAAIERDTEATGIRVERGRVCGVDTARGSIDAPFVINAAGPHARAVGRMASVDVPVDPYRRHIFIAADVTTPPNHLMVIDFETTFYYHREGAGILFGMGARDEAPTFDMTVQWDFLPQVVDVATTRLPSLAGASISHAWAGLYEMTPDHNPIISATRDIAGLFTIAGFSGHGFQHSPAAGRILADLVAGRDLQFDVTPFSLERFAPSRSKNASGERYVV
jgi:sarcosine oxidase subunit beta